MRCGTSNDSDRESEPGCRLCLFIRFTLNLIKNALRVEEFVGREESQVVVLHVRDHEVVVDHVVEGEVPEQLNEECVKNRGLEHRTLESYFRKDLREIGNLVNCMKDSLE